MFEGEHHRGVPAGSSRERLMIDLELECKFKVQLVLSRRKGLSGRGLLNTTSWDMDYLLKKLKDTHCNQWARFEVKEDSIKTYYAFWPFLEVFKVYKDGRFVFRRFGCFNRTLILLQRLERIDCRRYHRYPTSMPPLCKQ
jgi:hypothetical protein